MKVISLYSQKGGCGKTTLAVIISGYLAYVKGLNVVAIDTDYQGSFYKKRLRELGKMEDYADRMKQNKVKTIYDVISCDLHNFEDRLLNIKKNRPDTDYIIVDLPGNISDKNVLYAIMNSNIVITPLEHDPQALSSGLESSLVLTKKLHSRILKESDIEMVVGVLNKIPYSQLSTINNLLELINVVKFDYIFHNVIGRVDKMDDDRFCTLFPPKNQSVRGKSYFNIYGFLNELCQEVLKIE